MLLLAAMQALPPLPQEAPAPAITPKRSNTCSNLWKTVQVLVVCVTALVGLSLWKASSHTVTTTAPDGARIVVNVGAIESVLKQDRTTGTGSRSVLEVVNRMRAINTSECPNDFAAAYVSHIHAWEAMVEVERQAIAFKADREGAGDFVEGFIRGFCGDPLGKANEFRDAKTQLQSNYQAAREQVKQTFNHVEEVAVGYGAQLPKR